MRSGRRVFRYPRGTYTPVISDGRRIYLTGYSSVTALQPYKLKGRVADAVVAPEGKRPPEAKPRPKGKTRPAGKPGAERKAKPQRKAKAKPNRKRQLRR
jgi:hypothetical protein